MATQTINRNPRQPWRINKAILKNETISYSRSLNHQAVSIITKPGFTDVAMFLFDEIYTVSFSLDPIVEHIKDVWMVQDPEEPSTGRRLGEAEEQLFEETSQTGFQKHGLVNLIDIAAYMGAVWFFLTKFVFGPIVNHLNKPELVADIQSGEVRSKDIQEEEIELSEK